jgi:hypothetical protein
MSYFEEYGYDVADEVISEETAKLLEISMNMHRDCKYFTNRVSPDQIGYHNDILVEKCFGDYSILPCEALLEMVIPTVEFIVGKSLYPTYSYARIYYEGAEMREHKDRPSCEYSATMTISIDETPWDIWIEDLKGDRKSISLPTGSMMIYQGTRCPHWREPYKGKKQIQVFLHYVDVNGKYYNEMYDGRAMLASPPLRMPYRELSSNMECSIINNQ